MQQIRHALQEKLINAEEPFLLDNQQLSILDKNTVMMMIEEQQATIEQQKQELSQKDVTIDQQKQELSQQRQEIDRLLSELEEARQKK